MLKAGDLLLDKYKILYQIGQGGMSKVWLAIDTHLNKQWAVKEISKRTAEYETTVNENQTITEIELMKKLSHPSLPRIVDIIDSKDTLCIIMDYIEGETLLKLLNMYGKQSEELVVPWMLEVCDILTYLHSQTPPIIYRDMKPSNIMINPDGHVKIIDFGIAREYKGNAGDTMPLGTRGYASPEHFTKHTDERSDVYTVGATMFQALTGADPASPPYTIVPIRELDPSLSTGLEKIINKATRQNPDERYQSTEELASALESYKSLDDDYLLSLSEKIKAGKTRIKIGLTILIMGLVISVAGIFINNQNYNKLVSNIPATKEAALRDLSKAIEINPREAEAYTKLITFLSEDGKFTEEESAEFLSVYNNYNKQVKITKKVNETNYKIGESYLKYYTGKTDDSARARLLAAEPFFINAGAVQFAEDYVYLAEYYKNYVLVDTTLIAKDQTKTDYEELLTECNKIIEKQADKNIKIKNLTYNAIIGILDSERITMKRKGVAESKIVNTLNNINSFGTIENKENARRILTKLN